MPVDRGLGAYVPRVVRQLRGDLLWLRLWLVGYQLIGDYWVMGVWYGMDGFEVIGLGSW